LVASIFVRQNNIGQSIQQLVDSIATKVNYDIDLTDKLNSIVCKTLGNSLEQSIRIKFDYNIAKDSLQFYRQQDISKIGEIHIPNGVSEVRYKSDLTEIYPINIKTIEQNGNLFGSI
jgi:hypothetical protein